MTQEILSVVLQIAEEMTCCGAEISRIEESITRMLCAYGARRADVFATTSNMIVTVEDGEGAPLTQTRRIRGIGTDMTKLDKLNALVREICAKAPPVTEIKRSLSQIRAERQYPDWLVVLCYAMISASFCVFFGSRSFAETIAAFGIGLFVGILVKLFERVHFNRMLDRFACSFCASSLAFLLVRLGALQSPDHTIIGIIMTLIPGVGLTNALRDLFVGDLFTGMLRLLEALLIAVSIGLGFIVTLILFGGV